MKLTDDAVEYRAVRPGERVRDARRRTDQAVDHPLAAVVRCRGRGAQPGPGRGAGRRPPTTSAPLPPEKAALGVAVFGVPVLMILASMTVTGEYRSGMIRTTFMATPNRTLVLVAKAVVAAVFSAVCAAVMVIGSVVVARLVAKPLVGSQLSLTDTGHLAAGRRDRAVRGAGRGARCRCRRAVAAHGRRGRGAAAVAVGGRTDARESAQRRHRSRALSAVRRTRSCSPGCRGCIPATPCRGVSSDRWCTSPSSSRWCSSRRSWW